jgi:hypothetical protein
MKRTRLFTLALSVICLGVIAVATAKIVREHHLIGIGDWLALWSAPVIARSLSPASLYDWPSLHAAQTALGLPADKFGPFPYPPTFLAILWPLGSLSVGAAFAVFMIAGFLLYLVASTDSRWTFPFAALNPGVVINFLVGQTGLLSGGLMLGAARLITRHPVAAGALFGVLSYKPQLGIMVPVALLAARQWTCIASATITTALMIAATSWCFGVGAWEGCWQSLGEYAQTSYAQTRIEALSPTVSAMLRSMGASDGLAMGAQVVTTIVSAIGVWISWRNLDARHPLPAIVVLCAATFLATPHALFYDLTMLSGSLILYASHYRASLHTWETYLILIGISLPATATLANIDPLVLAAILWMACTARERRSFPMADENTIGRSCLSLSVPRFLP